MEATSSPSKTKSCAPKAATSSRAKTDDNGKGDGGKEDKANKGGAGKTKGLNQEITEAMKVKQRYLTISSKASTMLAAVEGDADWVWANGEDNIGRAKKALEEMQRRTRELGNEDLLHADPKELRQLGADALRPKLRSFTSVADEVKKLEAAHEMIWRMHKARQSKI